MNLARMTEIYQRGGREELIAAVERFSIATKAELLAGINTASTRKTPDNRREAVPESRLRFEDCSY